MVVASLHHYCADLRIICKREIGPLVVAFCGALSYKAMSMLGRCEVNNTYHAVA